MIRKLGLGAVGATTAALAVGYVLAGFWPAAAGLVGLGVLWLIGQWRGPGWVAPAGLSLCALAAGVGVLGGVDPLWMLVGLVAAASAWDLNHFSRLAESAERVEQARALQLRHLLRLVIVDLLSLLFGTLALEVQLRPPLGVMLLLGLAAAIALNRAITALRREA